jgi:hypothetical protein
MPKRTCTTSTPLLLPRSYLFFTATPQVVKLVSLNHQQQSMHNHKHVSHYYLMVYVHYILKKNRAIDYHYGLIPFINYYHYFIDVLLLMNHGLLLMIADDIS